MTDPDPRLRPVPFSTFLDILEQWAISPVASNTVPDVVVLQRRLMAVGTPVFVAKYDAGPERTVYPEEIEKVIDFFDITTGEWIDALAEAS